MDELNPEYGDYECVEPSLGDHLWRLEDPTLEAPLADQLRNHLLICDACRLRSATYRRLAAGLADGTLVLRPAGRTGPARPPRASVLTWSGGLAAAASLVLMLLLPPEARDAGTLARSGDQLRFLRPVEGEVVRSDRVRLSWAPIRGATKYRLIVSEVDGDNDWRGETTAPVLVLPDSVRLSPARDYRAWLEPVPADLAPAGGVSVSFRTGDLPETLLYRLTASPFLLKLLALGGLALGAGAGVTRLFRR